MVVLLLLDDGPSLSADIRKTKIFAGWMLLLLLLLLLLLNAISRGQQAVGGCVERGRGLHPQRSGKMGRASGNDAGSIGGAHGATAGTSLQRCNIV